MTGTLAATNDRFLVNPMTRWRGQESALEGRPVPVILAPTNGRFRRVSPIASGRSDGPLSDHRAGGQPAQRELVFMPHFRTLDLRDRREFGSS
jgi:hypothetical protein